MRALLASALTLSLCGCNAIFGITEGTLGDGGGDEGGGGSTGVSQGGGGASTGGAPPTGGGGDGGAGGGVPDPECEPDLLQNGQAIDAGCGVFVQQNAPAGGDGSQAMPFNDLGTALGTAADGQNIYLCGGPTFTGNHVLDAGRALIGGVRCDWTADPSSRPRLVGAADLPALVIRGAGSARLQNLSVQAPTPTTLGGSAVAVWVDVTAVTIVRTGLETDVGGRGADGDLPPGAPLSAPSGVSASTCVTVGPAGGQNLCNGIDVSGGAGGRCTTGQGNPGLQGLGPAGGQGGTWNSSSNQCTNGFEGGAGNTGSGGFGAARGGTLGDSAYLPGGPGSVGEQGATGSGGGGGASRTGGTGGGGGAGGCGGIGGRGGHSGGASFPLVLRAGANAELIESALTAGRGGAGCDGAAGQVGAQGGQGGSHFGGCFGGKGGNGGLGGRGGGGAGGPSAAVAMDVRSNVVADAATLGNLSVAPGGLGGQGSGAAGTAGAEGFSCQLLRMNADPTGQCASLQ